MLEELWAIREEVGGKKPLVVNLTNTVVTNFTANVLLALGASPIMTEGEAEARELAGFAGAVVLNIGTLHPRQVDYFLKIGRYANEFNKPLIVDPVGFGATTYRNETVQQLLEQLRVTLIRGNYGEITALAGTACGTKGVDSLVSEIDAQSAKVLAEQTKAIVCATGETDILTDGTLTYTNQTGHELLQLVTGTGCALTSVIGAFMAVSEKPAVGALAALAFYGAAAEKAAEQAMGPGSFAANFIDALYNLRFAEFESIARGRITAP